VKNLAAAGEAAWWVNGVRRGGRAVVFAPGQDWPEEKTVPEAVRACAEVGWRPLVAAGWAVAVLVAEA
jgi:hypothetical protein